MTPSCLQCHHSRGEKHGCCTRPKKLQDGSIKRLLVPWATERDERDKFWKQKARDMADVCGASGKWWVER